MGVEPFHEDITRNLATYLPPHSVLVVNNSRVVPARVYLQVEHRRHEFLFVSHKTHETQVVELKALIRNRKHIQVGTPIAVTHDLTLRYQGPASPEHREIFGPRVKEISPLSVLVPMQPLKETTWCQFLNDFGELAIPPYLRRAYDPVRDSQDYQTIFADRGHSIAAPTAGLHFSAQTLHLLKSRNIQVVPITLNVGYGTFQDIETDDIRAFRIHPETYVVPQASWEAIQNSDHVTAVGTTTLRALESFCRLPSPLCDKWLQTDLFIYPGFKFKCVNRLVTNFHLPRSSLLCLVSAFSGLNNIRAIYQHALQHRFRFFSFGDAMVLTRKGSP
jgi:S-adenosylmethionine:tRNA ribosyltransferase-isomerase